MKNKCKTCGHDICPNCGEKFTPEDEGFMNMLIRTSDNNLIIGKQTDKLYNTEYTSKSEIEPKGNIKPPDTQSPKKRTMSEDEFKSSVATDTFCLKDKIKNHIGQTFGNEVVEKQKCTPYVKVKFVKEFIKILKEKEIIKKYGSIDIVKTGTVKIEDIDKLAGDL